MKIAIFSDCYLDLTGGIVSVINAEKLALEQRGHTVEVFTSAYPHSDAELKQLSRKHIYPVPSCKIFGCNLTPIARRPSVVEKWLIKNHPEIQNYDVYYIHYEAGCSIAGLRLAKRFNIPSVQVMHGREDVGEEKLIPCGLRTIVATLLNWFHSWYLPHSTKVHRDHYLATTIARAKMWTLMVNHANYADLVITPSEHFAKKLHHYGVVKTIIPLHHGVSDELIAEHVAERKLDLGTPIELIWHSRLSGEKRTHEFLQALQILQNDFGNNNYHLTMYGDGPDGNSARKYAHHHNLNIDFCGVQPFKMIWPKIKSAHLDVLVSYNYDTFGMTLIEAAAAGTPTLFVDKDMQEILPPGSFVMADGSSPQQIAAAINELINHPERISSMSKALLKHRSNLKISRKIDQLERIFTNLMLK